MSRVILIFFVVMLAVGAGAYFSLHDKQGISFTSSQSASEIENEESSSYVMPSVLKTVIQANMYIEEYMSAIVPVVRRQALDKQALTAIDLERVANENKNKAQRLQLRSLVKYDYNLDRSVSYSELREGLKRIPKNSYYVNSPESISKKIEFHMKLDKNNDKVLSHSEMASLTERQKASLKNDQGLKRLQAYLDMDPDKDGRLTLQELEELAKQSFETADLNSDLYISVEEHALLEEGNRIVDDKRVFSGECRFKNLKLPEDFLVYSASGYSAQGIDYQIDKRNQAGQNDVYINKTPKPLVLILGHNEPTIWNMIVSDKADLRAVVVLGYHKQIVHGLSNKTPVIINTLKDKKLPCGYIRMSGGDGDDNVLIDQLSHNLFSKSVDQHFALEKPLSKIVFGDKEEEQIEQVVPYEKYRFKGTPMVGKKGLEEALREGKIRKATEEDKQLMLEKAKDKTRQDKSKSRYSRQFLEMANQVYQSTSLEVYVVQKEFVYPVGLRDRAVFIVPEGVPGPIGGTGHAKSISFLGFACSNKKMPSCMKFDKSP